MPLRKCSGILVWVLCIDRKTLDEANPPVGLLADGQFESARVQLRFGSRVLLVSDGITEAEDQSGNFFADDGLEHAAHCVDITEMLDLV